jgi:hypothetical protein
VQAAGDRGDYLFGRQRAAAAFQAAVVVGGHDAVTLVTTRLFAGLDPDDLATAHRLLARIIE